MVWFVKTPVPRSKHQCQCKYADFKENVLHNHNKFNNFFFFFVISFLSDVLRPCHSSFYTCTFLTCSYSSLLSYRSNILHFLMNICPSSNSIKMTLVFSGRHKHYQGRSGETIQTPRIVLILIYLYFHYALG